MALVYYRTRIIFTDNDNKKVFIDNYRKCDSTVYTTDSATTESYAIEVAYKENSWNDVTSYTIASAQITKAEYNKYVADTVDPLLYLEDLTPPDGANVSDIII